MKYLVDSDYVADFLKGRQHVLPLFQRFLPEGIGISIITFAEVYEGCIGYLAHPFKNKPVETENNRHFLLANRGVSVYNQTSLTVSSCSKDNTFM